MDTRTKILPSLDLHAGIERVVVGYFDPVTAAHAKRLHELGAGDRSLAVVLAEPPDPLLTREARAELVAALAVVDQVVMADGSLPAGFEIVHEESADAERRQALIRHIHARQAAAKA